MRLKNISLKKPVYDILVEISPRWGVEPHELASFWLNEKILEADFMIRESIVRKWMKIDKEL